MSVIIRLQGLPWSASALDIRHFFKGLTIPAGGVHIIGGERGDAFIAFGSDEDARQAMMRNALPLSGTPVQLFLSSKSEMQNVIEEARAAEAGVVVAGSPATQIGSGSLQGASTGQMFQGQGYPSMHEAPGQRFPQQGEPHSGRDGQGQLMLGQPAQNFPVTSHGQGHLNRDIQSQQQFGFQGDRNQVPNQNSYGGGPNQMLPGSGQFRIAEGNQPSDARYPYNQDDMGNFGFAGAQDADYPGNDQQQWHGPGQDMSGSRQYFGTENSQGKFGFQGMQNTQRSDQYPSHGRDSQLLGQQQFPGQVGDQAHSQDPLLGQQNFYGPEGKQPNEARFQMRQGKPAFSDPHMAGIPSRPGIPVAEDEQASGRGPEMKGVGLLGARPGATPNLRVPGDDRMMSQGSLRPQLSIDQRQSKGFEHGRPGVSLEEGIATPGGMSQGFQRGQGMPPTGDIPPLRHSLSDNRFPHGEEGYDEMAVMERGHWPGYEDDDMNRRGPHGPFMDRGRDHPMDMRPNAELPHPDEERGRERGQFPEGGDSDFRSAAQPGSIPFGGPRGRGVGRRFEGHGGRFDSNFPGPRGIGENDRFSGPDVRGFEPSREFQHQDMREYEHPREMGMDDTGIQDMEVDESFQGPRGRGFDVSRGRGLDGGRGRGFDRSRGRGFDRFGAAGSQDFGHHGYGEEQDDYGPYAMQRENEKNQYGGDDMRMGERGFDGERQDLRRPPFGKRDFDSRSERGRGRGDAGRGRGGGPGMPVGDIDTDRRWNREDIDTRGRERNWRDGNTEVRATKGLLGDAPPGVGEGRPLMRPFETPVGKDDADKDQRAEHGREAERDRDRRGYADRRYREERSRDDSRARGRDDRFVKRSDRRSYDERGRGREDRDRSADRERSSDRHSRRGERDHRSDRRDRDKDRERERSSTKDRDTKSSKSSDTPKDTSAEKRSSDTEKNGVSKNTEADKKSDNGVKSEESSSAADHRFLQVKNLPQNFNYKDIRRFFAGCEIPFDGLKIINDISGKRTGEVYIKFANEESGKRAFKKNGERVLGNLVSVSTISNKEFESQVDSQKPPENPDESPAKRSQGEQPPVVKPQDKNSLIVLVQGLPQNVTREEILNFFQSVDIADSGDAIFIEYDSRGQCTGIAYIEVVSVQDFKTAVGHDGRSLGTRALKVSAGRREEMDILLKKQQEMFERQSSKTSEQSGQGLLGNAPSSRPSLMGPRPPVPLMSLFGGPPRNGPVSDPSQQKGLGDKSYQSAAASTCVHLQGLSMMVTYKDIREFFQGLNILPRGVQIVHDGMGKPLGEGFVEFATIEDREEALKRDKKSMGHRVVAVKVVSKMDMIERLRNARLLGLPPGQGPPPMHHFKPIPPGVLNPQWYYLRCQNFPGNTAVKDIVNFFQDFSPIRESIRLHFSSDGSQTGNAVVGFGSYEDRQRALQEMNGKFFRRSAINLMPITS